MLYVRTPSVTPVGAHVFLLKINFNVYSPGVSVQS